MIVFLWTEVKICVYCRLRLQSSSCGRSLKQTFPKSVHRRLKRQSEAMFHVVHTTYCETGLTIMLNSVFYEGFSHQVLSEVNRIILRPGQTLATFQRNILQHCWAQHVAYVWPPCCDMLRCVATCWMMLDQI